MAQRLRPGNWHTLAEFGFCVHGVPLLGSLRSQPQDTPAGLTEENEEVATPLTRGLWRRDGLGIHIVGNQRPQWLANLEPRHARVEGMIDRVTDAIEHGV